MLKNFNKLNLLILLSFANSSLAGNIIHLEHSARQTGLAGAFVAQIDDGTSMISNPAGFSPSLDSNTRITEFSLNGALLNNFEADLGDDELISMSLIWGAQKKESSFGIGVFDSIAQDITYFDPESESQKTDFITGYDFIFNGAWTLNEHIKVGISPRITSAGPEKTDVKSAQSDSEWAVKVGTQVNLLDGAHNFGLSTSTLDWNIGATYQPEVSLKVYEKLKGHVLSNRKISVLPDSIHLGSNMAISWLSEASNIVLHLNADIERQSHSELSDLILATPTAEDIKFTRTSLGAELQYKQGNSKLTYIIRAGQNERTCEEFTELDESTIAMGLGLSSSSFTLDLAHQITSSSSKNKDTKRGVMSLSWTF